MLIGIEMWGDQHPRTLGRGIGRYTQQLVAALLARDRVNQYVLYYYGQLAHGPLPAGNASLRTLRFGKDPGQPTDLERLTRQNPDHLDLLLLTCPLYPSPKYVVPPRPANNLRMAAVVYDLIPALFPGEYLRGDFARWYYRDLQALRRYDGLLAISAATKADCEALLGVPPRRVFNIRSAGDGDFFHPPLEGSRLPVEKATLKSIGVTRPFVFNVGAGLEWRKNFHGLLKGFALLPKVLREEHQLVVSCQLQPGEAGQMRRAAEEWGVGRQLVLTGAVPDPTLRILYQRCAAFVFPSRYEGFGLPLLEAMLCGAAVIGGQNSAQPEVIGDAGLLADAGQLTDPLARLLTDRELARTLRERAQHQARQFHWDHTTDAALAAFRNLAAKPAPSTVRKQRLAFFGALPPQEGRAAEEALRLLALLKPHYHIDVYHEENSIPQVGFNSNEFACYDHRLFRRHWDLLNYRNVVYYLGSGHCQGFVGECLLRQEGVVILNDAGVDLDRRFIKQATAVVVPDAGTREWVRRVYPECAARTTDVPIQPGMSGLFRDIIERTAVRRPETPRMGVAS